MKKVLVAEFKSFKFNPFQKVTAFFTGRKYYHSGMVIVDDDNVWFADLAMGRGDDGDYQIIDTKTTLENFINKEGPKGVDFFEVPKKFTDKQIEKMIKWWTRRHDLKKKYGLNKLTTFPLLAKMQPFYYWYYRQNKRPYIPKADIPNQDVCSVAVDQCLKLCGFDVFPELSERVVYPGMFAERLKKYKVKTGV